jgi:hypothetical protein
MSLYKEQLEKGPIRYGKRRSLNRSRWRTWAKNQLARLMRRKGKALLDDAPKKPRYIGYE